MLLSAGIGKYLSGALNEGTHEKTFAICHRCCSIASELCERLGRGAGSSGGLDYPQRRQGFCDGYAAGLVLLKRRPFRPNPGAGPRGEQIAVWPASVQQKLDARSAAALL